MEDKKFLAEIFKRLDGNFYGLNNDGTPCVLTDSEVAADSLEETLLNLDLGGVYERIDKVNDNGIWEARFILKGNEYKKRTEYRVMVKKYGYATIKADSEEGARKKSANMWDGEFDWATRDWNDSEIVESFNEEEPDYLMR